MFTLFYMVRLITKSGKKKQKIQTQVTRKHQKELSHLMEPKFKLHLEKGVALDGQSVKKFCSMIKILMR
jgi:hypothetical protein